MSMSGSEGTMEAFKKIKTKRRIFIHINNTNPVLLPDSQESRTVQDAGWEIAYDGMEIEL